MAAPVFVDGVTPLNAPTLNALGTEVNGKLTAPAVVNGQWIKGVGGAAVWSAITPADVGLPKITAQAIAVGPPPAPADGDIWIATTVDLNGTVWHFRYNAGSASAYKWEFIGGLAVLGTAAGLAVAAINTWTNLVGSNLAAPRAGEYRLSAGCTSSHPNIATNAIGIAVNGVAAIVLSANTGFPSAGGYSASITIAPGRVVLAAAATVGVSGQSNAANASFSSVAWEMVPFRIS